MRPKTNLLLFAATLATLALGVFMALAAWHLRRNLRQRRAVAGHGPAAARQLTER